MACASAVTVLAPVRVKALLRGPNNDRVCVIDVRDADFEGGHIRGAVNVVAETFEDNVLVDRVVSRFCRGMDIVIVHCYLSQQRGPYCAQRLAERLEAQGCSEPEICVMAGGWKRFRRELEVEDFELVEDFLD
jgi:Cdc25 family phosphatase